MKECKHEITLKNICCLCGSETFTKNKQFCHLTTTEIIKSTTYQHKQLTLILDLDETIVNTTSISLFSIPINKLQEITYISSLNNLSTKEINLNNQSIIFDLIFKFNNFIKLRKNAIKFLKKINFFKLYIFSMGTKECVEIIKKYLNNQGINVCGSISREENMSFSKSVSRLGLSERRVVILDDRLDVWDYLDCVILVKPFLFYKNVKSVCEKSYEVNKKIKLEDMGVERKGVYLNKNVFVESESFLDEQTNCQNKNLTDCQHKNLTDRETNLTDCQNKNLTKEDVNLTDKETCLTDKESNFTKKESNFTNKNTNLTDCQNKNLTDKETCLTDCQNKNFTKEESNFTKKETNLTNEYLEYNLLDLIPLLKKVKKKFKKIKNTKKILKKERKKLFKNLQFHFYLNDDLILLGNFFKVKYIKNVNKFNILDDLILVRDKNKVFYVNKEWFYLCVYFRKMVDYKAFVFKECDYESEESFNEDEYL